MLETENANRVDKSLIYLFLFFLLFSNLMSRVLGADLNSLFYLIFLAALVRSLRYTRWNQLTLAQIAVLFFFITYTLIFMLDSGIPLYANIISIKDFLVPILCLTLGYYLFTYRRDSVNFFNLIFVFFAGYGVLQEIAFYAGVFPTLLPWDAALIDEKLSLDINNYFQGSLLRFFGAMDSFVEYQIYVVFSLLFLWLNLDLIQNKRLFSLNLVLSVVFLVLSLERSPLLMSAIVLIIWKANYITARITRVWVYALIGVVVAGLFFYVGENMLKQDPTMGAAYERLSNALSLNLAEDEAIAARGDEEWKESLELVSKNLTGIGPGRVAPSASGFEGYLAPHNNYFALYLGYSALGLILFAFFIILALARLSTLESGFRHFGYGMVASYCAQAIFNVPFSGKAGILFFVMLGYLAATKSSTPERARRRLAVVARQEVVA